MKSIETEDLSKEELETLRGLMQRWVLITFPFEDWTGCSEMSDAIQTYYQIKEHAGRGYAACEEQHTHRLNSGDMTLD